MIIAEIPKANYCSFFCFLLTMDECIINVWGYTEILPKRQKNKLWTILRTTVSYRRQSHQTLH